MDLDQKKGWSSYDAVDQYTAIAFPPTDILYLVDALGDKLTATGRMAYVQACLSADGGQAVRWAICQSDVAALDPTKVLAELRADAGHDGYVRTALRLELAAVRHTLREHAARVKELLAKDEACTASRRTNRITHILPDGTFVYREVCTKTAVVTVDRASPPRDINPRHAKGLKPGMIVSVAGRLVEAAWDKESSTIPSMVFGVAVK